MRKLLLCAVLLATSSAHLQAQQILKVGYSEAGAAYRPAITAIYQEAGLVPEFVLLPLERSLRSVDSGEIDADIGRAAGSTVGYPNAIETSESVLVMHLLAVVKRDFKAARLTPAELKGYKLGHIRGAKMPENLLKSLGLGAARANTVPQLFQMVTLGRFDVALNVSTTPLSAYPEFADSLMTLQQPVLTTTVFHVLNKKWADYVPKIDAAIRAMRSDGRMAKLLPARP